FLPDGEHFLFWAGNFSNASDDQVSGFYVTSLEAKEKKFVLHARSNLGLAAGKLFYVDEKQQLLIVAFDTSTYIVSGDTQGVADFVGFQPSTYWGAFTVAEDGTLVYSASMQTSLSRLTWFDRTGKEVGHLGEAGVFANPSISPGGDRVMVDVTDF